MRLVERARCRWTSRCGRTCRTCGWPTKTRRAGHATAPPDPHGGLDGDLFTDMDFATTHWPGMCSHGRAAQERAGSALFLQQRAVTLPATSWRRTGKTYEAAMQELVLDLWPESGRSLTDRGLIHRFVVGTGRAQGPQCKPWPISRGKTRARLGVRYRICCATAAFTWRRTAETARGASPRRWP